MNVMLESFYIIFLIFQDNILEDIIKKKFPKIHLF